MWNTAGAVMTVRLQQANWGYASPVVGAKAMPNAIVASGLSYYSVPGTAFRYVYQSSIGLDALNLNRLLNRNNPVVVFKNKEVD
jgi:hypothetical protein